MEQQSKFNHFRDLYPEFYYRGYSYHFNDGLEITYHFEIPHLAHFHPIIKISKNVIQISYQKEYLEYFIFLIGLIELISYVKCTCSKKIIIEAGAIDKKQISFLKKLYYHGLGELLYRNKIEISEEELFDIICTVPNKKLPQNSYVGYGNLICVGGGKDSCVSLELLKEEDNVCFIINPKTASLGCAKAAGYLEKDIFCVERVIDPTLLKLNQEGFLNGHTPLSSIIAFLSYFCAYLSGRKNVVLSNESSANQSTVLGTNINHQYSKTYEFEKDFREYMDYSMGLEISYFSLLRGLSEYQIAKLFSHYSQYHFIFNSCNLGSKKEPWEWCCNCPKCLFLYIILSPFLSREKRIQIFGEDLLERKDLLEVMKELVGYSSTKPFECVGTYEEARYAISQAIQRGEEAYLLRYYKDHYPLELDSYEIVKYNEENSLDYHYNELVKKEIEKYD